jgi:hypothetical protein
MGNSAGELWIKIHSNTQLVDIADKWLEPLYGKFFSTYVAPFMFALTVQVGSADGRIWWVVPVVRWRFVTVILQIPFNASRNSGNDSPCEAGCRVMA